MSIHAIQILVARTHNVKLLVIIRSAHVCQIIMVRLQIATTSVLFQANALVTKPAFEIIVSIPVLAHVHSMHDAKL